MTDIQSPYASSTISAGTVIPSAAYKKCVHTTMYEVYVTIRTLILFIQTVALYKSLTYLLTYLVINYSTLRHTHEGWHLQR